MKVIICYSVYTDSRELELCRTFCDWQNYSYELTYGPHHHPKIQFGEETVDGFVSFVMKVNELGLLQC